jgi:WD40 repeat protein
MERPNRLTRKKELLVNESSVAVNSCKGERINLNLCNHLEGGYLNSFLVKDFVIDSGRIPRFFPYKNCRSITYTSFRSIFESFSLKNLSLDYTLIHNRTQTLSPSRDGCIFTMAFDSNEEHLASSNHLHQIEIWDFTTHNLIKTIPDHKEIVTCIEYFNKKSSCLFNDLFGAKEMMTCSLDKTIKLWKDYVNVHTFTEHSDWVRCLAINRDNKFFLSGCVSSVVKLWDINTGQVLRSIKNHNPDPDLLNTVNSLQFTHNGDNNNVFLCGLRSGTVKIFDLRVASLSKSSEGIDSPIKEFKAHKNKLNSVKFNASDSHLLTSGRDSLIRLWDYRKLPVSIKY